MSDIIYSDQTCGLLEFLGEQSGDPQLSGATNIAGMLYLDYQQYQRAQGRKGGKGWPYKCGARGASKPYDFIDNITVALNLIAQGYASPRRFMRLANEWLLESGIEILRLQLILDETPDAWQAEYPEDDANFRRFRDCIIERCHRECSSVAAAMKASQEQSLAYDSSQVRSLAWLALAAVLDEPCTIAVAHGLQMPWEPDGKGRVEGVEASSFTELFDRALPHALKCRLHAVTGAGDPAASLADPDYLQGVRSEVMSHFLQDGGHQFVSMVGNCRMLLAPATDGVLLNSRCERVFSRLAQTSRDPAAVRASLSCVRRYAQGDSARVLASTMLALMVGPEQRQVLGSVTQRR